MTHNQCYTGDRRKIRNLVLYPAELRARPRFSAFPVDIPRSPVNGDSERSGNTRHTEAHWRHNAGHTDASIKDSPNG